MSGFATVFQDHVDANLVHLCVYNNSALGLVRTMTRAEASRLAAALNSFGDAQAPWRPLEGAIVHFEVKKK